MKKFFIVSLGLLLIAILLAVGVFFYLSFNLKQSQIPVSATQTELKVMNDPVGGEEVASTSSPEGIPLRDLPIGEGQQAVLDTVGVDVETFVITPEMQVCAAEKLGELRMAEIIAGAAPTLYETTKLLTCL